MFYKHTQDNFQTMVARELRTGDVLALNNGFTALYGEMYLETVVQTKNTTILWYELPKGARITSGPTTEVTVKEDRTVQVKQEIDPNEKVLTRKK